MWNTFLPFWISSLPSSGQAWWRKLCNRSPEPAVAPGYEQYLIPDGAALAGRWM